MSDGPPVTGCWLPLPPRRFKHKSEWEWGMGNGECGSVLPVFPVLFDMRKFAQNLRFPINHTLFNILYESLTFVYL
jgi:hypothetical protein